MVNRCSTASDICPTDFQYAFGRFSIDHRNRIDRCSFGFRKLFDTSSTDARVIFSGCSIDVRWLFSRDVQLMLDIRYTYYIIVVKSSAVVAQQMFHRISIGSRYVFDRLSI